MKKSYKHIGVCPVHLLGQNGDGDRVILPGQEFEAEIDPELEAFLTRIEAIAVVSTKRKESLIKPTPFRLEEKE